MVPLWCSQCVRCINVCFLHIFWQPKVWRISQKPSTKVDDGVNSHTFIATLCTIALESASRITLKCKRRSGTIILFLFHIDVISKSDQFQISPAASPDMIPHSMENLSFHSSLGWKLLSHQFSLPHLSIFFKGWENVLFELGSERVKMTELFSVDTYPPSTISSMASRTPSKLSMRARFSTFFLSIWLTAS